MKHIVRKPYWNYEKEEKWLNDMSAKGLALRDYSWCRYVFEDADEGEYIFRIVLFDHPANHPESRKKIAFFEDMGIEFVASYMRWVYLRKKTADGPFELHSDIDTKIVHYKKVAALWLTLACVEFCIGASNITIGLLNDFTKFNLVIGCVLVGMGLIFTCIWIPILRKVRRLKKQRMISEN